MLFDISNICGGPGSELSWDGRVRVSRFTIQFFCQRILVIDGNQFPICFAFVQQSHHAQDLDLLGLSIITNFAADFAHIDRIVVASRLGVQIHRGRVFPCLKKPRSGAALQQRYSQTWLPEAVHHSSKCSLCRGNSCGRSVLCPSWRLVWEG